MNVSYGCNNKNKPYDFYVYRITKQLANGSFKEYTPAEIIRRCSDLSLKVVPQLKTIFSYDGNKEALLDICRQLSNGPSVLDDSHLEEGVVLRVLSPFLKKEALKYKGYYYRELEDLAVSSEEYVDLEEVL
jgi:hypothetical protein